MQYIAYAKRGDYEKCAHESFDCVGCNICAARCPAGISHSLVGILTRRLTAKYLQAVSEHNIQRTIEIKNGKFDTAMDEIMTLSDAEIRDLYNKREIEN